MNWQKHWALMLRLERALVGLAEGKRLLTAQRWIAWRQRVYPA